MTRAREGVGLENYNNKIFWHKVHPLQRGLPLTGRRDCFQREQCILGKQPEASSLAPAEYLLHSKQLEGQGLEDLLDHLRGVARPLQDKR